MIFFTPIQTDILQIAHAAQNLSGTEKWDVTITTQA
jgi:hypothetical protein